jgi:hypothetical protein
MNEFWKGFNPNTEKAVQTPTGPQRIPIPPEVFALRTLEPTDAEDVWGWDACKTYKLRRLYGVQSVADVAGAVQILTPPAQEGK